MKAAILGGGVIGGGWVARFLLNGWDVSVYDPDPSAERKIHAVLANARRSLPALYDKLLPEEGSLLFAPSLDEAVADASWVQESAPERLDLKHRVLGDAADAAPAAAIIASSTSGFKPSDLNNGGGRAIVAHPFNPVYLLPLVELVGDPERTARAAELLSGIGMFPLKVRKEIDAHIADRFLEAVWREGLWLIQDGIATTKEIDDAIRMGFGLRWAQMGLFETYRIAGGEAGMSHFIEQFGPALQWPWTKLMNVPELTPELIGEIAAQSDAQSGHKTIRELERERDDNLVAMLRALKKTRSGAGDVIRTHETSLPAAPAQNLPITLRQSVPQSWTDYNGHMNEAHYLEAGSVATDGFLELVGVDAAYVDRGLSYFTVETHVCFLAELNAGENLKVTTQVLSAHGKKLHLFHRLYGQRGDLAATVETLLLHVDLKTRNSCAPGSEVTARLERYASAHAELARPDQAGRAIRT